MKEIPYTSKLIYTEDGRPLALNYSILVSGGNGEPEYYGVKIVERKIKDQSLNFALTTDLERIYRLIDKLARNSVTPTGVTDVLIDWL